MATIAPFKGIHYNPSKVSNLSDVIVPPYDNIPAGEEKKYFERNPYNFAHLILPQKANDDYTETAARLAKWRETGVLKQDSTPGYYLYQQNFTIDGHTYQRKTLMCLVLLHDFKEAIVRPHENTYGQYKADRLAILKATKHNLSHIFGMVKDPDGILEAKYETAAYSHPLLVAKSDEGVEHSVWRIEGSAMDSITKFFADKPIYIVDGHHRYESSLTYARENNAVGDKNHPAAYMLFAIANCYDPGLIALPTHRIVTGVAAEKRAKALIEDHFDLSPLSYGELERFTKKTQKTPAFGLSLNGELFLARPKNPEAMEKEAGPALANNAVAWSDWKLLRQIVEIPDDQKANYISYEKDLGLAYKKSQNAGLAIFHAPLEVETIADVADAKGFMPQKSTFFYPKLAAGLILRSHV